MTAFGAMISVLLILASFGALPIAFGFRASKALHEDLPVGVIKATGNTIGYGEGKEEWRGEVIQLAWSPRLFYIKNLLSDAEVHHLKSVAAPDLTKSQVVDNDSGASKDSDIRTSTGTFLGLSQDKIIDRIEKRVAHITMLPVANQEGMQILRYVDGQKYEPHFDYFHDAVNADPKHGGQRIATLLMYLSTPLEGGETLFPNAERKSTGPEFSECAKRGLSVKPCKGDAVLFYSLKPDGTKDEASLHGSCPTLKGEKWSATKWIHVSSFNLDSNYQKAKWGDCVDTNDQCKEWAYFGECKKNPGFMLSTCRKSCKVCDPSSPPKEP